MIYRKFYLLVILRVVLILATCLWFSEALRGSNNLYTVLVISGLLLIQVMSLIYSINSVNRDVSKFFSGIEELGSTVLPNFSISEASSRELKKEIYRVSELIRNSRLEAEERLKYFEFVLDIVPVGMIITNSLGEIHRINSSAREIFSIDNLKDIVSLDRVSEGLGGILRSLPEGESVTLKISINGELLSLLLRSAEFISKRETIRLYSVQNVTGELSDNELLSWQKLTRVLTHEIMNSLTPISSLAFATRKCLSTDGEAKTKETIDNNSIKDAVLNLNLVEERSDGIKRFVSNFKEISRIPQLNLAQTNINALAEESYMTLKEDFGKDGIVMSLSLDISIKEIMLDPDLIKQVVINILKNSAECFSEKGDKKITISSFGDNRRVGLQIKDNGPGISEDIQENIFIPFFTTKPEGSGIGLSLAQLIIRKHNGNISVKSFEGKGCTVTLSFYSK